MRLINAIVTFFFCSRHEWSFTWHNHWRFWCLGVWCSGKKKSKLIFELCFYSRYLKSKLVWISDTRELLGFQTVGISDTFVKCLKSGHLVTFLVTWSRPNWVQILALPGFRTSTVILIDSFWIESDSAFCCFWITESLQELLQSNQVLRAVHGIRYCQSFWWDI